VDGIPDIVHDGSNGLLVPPADDIRLAYAILRVYSQPELRMQLGQAGQQLSRQYTPDIMASAYLKLYRGITASADKP
jgi:glycosyltransferase involved in cell wall biosynthesis